MRYIALLRGINVSGKNMIKMEELRQMFEALGFTNVTSYINSGNIAFDIGSSGNKASLKSQKEIAERIEAAIEKSFGLVIQTMVRTQADIRRAFELDPFSGRYESHKEMHLLFLKQEMDEEKQAELLGKQTDNERFLINGREIYCHLKLGVADSLLGKGFIEKKLKTPVTARNWRTVQKLAEL